MKKRYAKLEKQINIDFNDYKLLEEAFIHKSHINEINDKDIVHNERLEFLGDAVLELITTEHLFKNYPHDEGVLTNWRAALVRGRNLAKAARKLGLGEYLYLSKGEEKSGGREKNYILANAFEALIGAVYLDKGINVTKKFVEETILSFLEEILEKGQHIDAKSAFQEIAQEKEEITPEYKLVEDEGPDHDKIFTMAAYLGDEKVADGKGTSKQNAEQDAARNALKARGWEV